MVLGADFKTRKKNCLPCARIQNLWIILLVYFWIIKKETEDGEEENTDHKNNG